MFKKGIKSFTAAVSTLNLKTLALLQTGGLSRVHLALWWLGKAPAPPGP